MNYRIIIINIAITLCTLVRSESTEDNNQKRSLNEHGGAVEGGQLISQQVEIIKQVPVVHYAGIPVPVPHQVGVPVHVPIHVPEPVLIQVPFPIPIYKTVHIPVEKAVPVPVEKPYPVEIIEKVPVEVPKPYPVHVPIYKTKHIYHVSAPAIKHGWW